MFILSPKFKEIGILCYVGVIIAGDLMTYYPQGLNQQDLRQLPYEVEMQDMPHRVATEVVIE